MASPTDIADTNITTKVIAAPTTGASTSKHQLPGSFNVASMTGATGTAQTGTAQTRYSWN